MDRRQDSGGQGWRSDGPPQEKSVSSYASLASGPPPSYHSYSNMAGGRGGGRGRGRDGGRGGQQITGSIEQNRFVNCNGTFGSLTSLTPTGPAGVDRKADVPDGGVSIKCSKGTYYRDQGKSPCEDLGTVKFRWSDGTELTDTASIDRGYKAGLNFIQTAGKKQTDTSGNGGNGTTGGQGGSNGYGGGGGSGFNSGITGVTSQEGGSTFSDAKVILRVVT